MCDKHRVDPLFVHGFVSANIIHNKSCSRNFYCCICKIVMIRSGVPIIVLIVNIGQRLTTTVGHVTET